jgi:hypothetical protein
VLAACKEKVGNLEKALTKGSADLDAIWTKAEATQKEYLNKMVAHTTRAKHSLSFDKILGEKKVELDGRERDLELREAALTEFIELRRLLQDAEAARIIEVGRLVTLVRNVSKVLQDHGMPPIPEFPRDSHIAGGILEVVDAILECLKEAYDSDYDPWE